MLSIEEIKLLIEKLEKVKKEDLQELIDSNLKILKDVALAIDANNDQVIDRLDKTPEWFALDNQQKQGKPLVDEALRRQVQLKILQFGRTNVYNSLEIGPGNGMFSMDFRTWGQQFFLDVLPQVEEPIRKMFPPAHQKRLDFIEQIIQSVQTYHRAVVTLCLVGTHFHSLHRPMYNNTYTTSKEC